MDDKTEPLLLLEKINNSIDPRFGSLNRLVLEDKRFSYWPASVGHHHCFIGGLLSHTLEVVRYCDFAASENSKVDRNILITGAIWHDYGKIWDYEECEKTKEKPLGWQHTSHKNRVRHICRSYLEFEKYITYHCDKKISNDDQERISHCILSHHRNPEYGSPIEPKTREAFIVHFSDCISAFGGATCGR